MEWIATHTADIVVLLILAVVVLLALRSVITGGGLDCSSCNGDCTGCGGTCKNPQVMLSKEQLAALDELDRTYGVSDGVSR